MARMNSKKSEVVRSCPEFKAFVDKMSRLKSSQENDRITPSRITEAIYNQYNKYPELLSELKMRKLGKWKAKR